MISLVHFLFSEIVKFLFIKFSAFGFRLSAYYTRYKLRFVSIRTKIFFIFTISDHTTNINYVFFVKIDIINSVVDFTIKNFHHSFIFICF